MSTPHVHALLIKAWADGAEIERWDALEDTWGACTNPQWYLDQRYRIKPIPKKKVTRWLWAFKYPRDVYWASAGLYLTEQEFTNWTSAKGIKLEWSAMEFDE